VGAAERSEAAIFPLALESQAKDQEITAFGSSYRAQRKQAPSPQVIKIPQFYREISVTPCA
ncbi:hypothetical protein, partial [Pseudomonas tehranensis]|uniref:hypothetical protein n=1 Tax=Pseudomonas tehranensis TaxID=2745502 RepID=UPI001CD8FB00